MGILRSLWLVLAAVILSSAAAGAASPTSPRPEVRPRAGQPLSFDEASRIAVANHPAIEQARYAAQIARAATKLTEGERYPWLEASVAESNGSLRIVSADGRTIHDQGGHGFDPGGALPHHNQNMLTGGVILNQLITDFGYTAHRILAHELKERVSEQELQTHKAQVLLNVQRAYVSTLLYQRLADLAETILRERRSARDRTASLYRNQLRSKVDLDLLEVEVSNAEYAVLQAQNDVRQQFATLNNALGLQHTDPYQLEPLSLAVQPLPPVESLVRTAIDARPELLGARERVQVAEEMVASMKALHFGSLSAVGVLGVTRYFDTHDNGIHDNEVAPFWGAGGTLRYPIFSGFHIQNQVSAAAHEKGAYAEELRQLANEVTFQVIRAYLVQTSNAEQIAVEQQRVQVAHEALALAQERYKVGLGSILDVIEAQTFVFEAESRLAQLQYLYKTGQVALDYATGHINPRY